MRTHNIPFSRQKKKITLIYPKSATVGICSTGLKNEFETAMVNEPSVFEPLKFYCNVFQMEITYFLFHSCSRGSTLKVFISPDEIGQLGHVGIVFLQPCRQG